MSVFKKPFNEQTQHQRNASKLDEALLNLDKARVDLEDHLFHAQETRTRVRMLENRIERLKAERELLGAPAEQISWLRKVVPYVRDAFSNMQPNSNATGKFQIVGATPAENYFFCKHIKEDNWVACTEQEYIELQEDPLYDLFRGPFGLQPPPVAQPMLYKPKNESSTGGAWALCSHTFYRANEKNSEIDFVSASE